MSSINVNPGSNQQGRSNPSRWSKIGGSSDTPEYQPKSIEEAQGTNPNVSAPAGSAAAEEVTQIQKKQQAQTEKTTEKTPQKPISRPMSEGDVADLLISMRKPITAENKQTVLAMLQHGIEASEENFNLINRLKRNNANTGNAIKSAVVSLAKGLASSPKSVDILAAFLANNAKVGRETALLQSQLRQFSQFLSHNGELFSKGLHGGLSSIISELDVSLKKLLQKNASSGLNLQDFKRGSLVRDFRVFSGFLRGLEDKVSKKDLPLLKPNLEKLQAKISGFLDTLTTQAVLSKNAEKYHMAALDNFAYWQLPNPNANPPKDIDILIRKDPTKKNHAINPKKTRMIIRFETEDMGELWVVIELLDNKVWYVFQTNDDDTKANIMRTSRDLKDRMETINYKPMGIRAEKGRQELKKILLPTYNLDTIARVSAEI